jgi:hypothetical protein
VLRFLLDSHVPSAVAAGLRRRGGAIDVVHLADWQGGRFLHASDQRIVEAALREGLALVTYDVRSIQPLLAEWAVRGRHHAGVVFVDDRAIAQNDVGGLIRALAALHESEADLDWIDRVVYLRPVWR